MSNKDQIRMEWKDRIKQFKQSGLSMKKWCVENGFKVHQLQYWLEKYKDEKDTNISKSNNWVAVKLPNNNEQPNKDEKLDQTENTTSNLDLKIGPCSIEIKPGFNHDLLLDVIKVLSLI